MHMTTPETNNKNKPIPAANMKDDGQTIGQFLANARMVKGFSLKKISHQTKISTSILEKLEGDLLEQLPNKAYVNGFVKSYAQILALNQDECLKILDETYSRNDKNTPLPKKADVLRGTEQEDSNSNYGLFAVVALIIAIGSTYLIIKSSKDENADKKIVTQELNEQTPLKDSNAADASDEATAPVIEVTPTETKPIVVEKPAPVVETKPVTVAAAPTVVKETADQTSSESDEEKSSDVNLRPLPAKLYDYADSDLSNKLLAEQVPENMQNAIVVGKQNVFIAAVSGDTWITYKKDSDDVKKFTLQKGKNILIRGDEIRVFLGNVNVTKIFLNNKLLNLPSRSGVKSLVFPETSAAKYKLPLFIYKDSGEVITSDSVE